MVFLFKAKPEDTLDLARILNDDLASTVRRYPKRFVGLGTLPMQAPELGTDEDHLPASNLPSKSQTQSEHDLTSRPYCDLFHVRQLWRR